VLLRPHGMNVAGIAKVAFTIEERVRDVIHNFNDDEKEVGRAPRPAQLDSSTHRFRLPS
jgi:hypothetical protein